MSKQIIVDKLVVDLPQISNSDLLTEFLDLNPDDLKKNTLDNYKSIVKMFISWINQNNKKHFFELVEMDLMKYKKCIAQDKNLSLKTKENRFNITKRFIKILFNLYLQEISKVQNIILVIQFLNNLDKKTKFSKDPSNHARGRELVFMTKQQIIKIFNELRVNYPYKYLMFRIYLESCPRKLGVISMNLDNNGIPIEKYLEKREIYIPKGKTGKHIYYCSQDLANRLLKYVKKRRNWPIKSNALFLSQQNKRFSMNGLNYTLAKILEKLGITDNITIHAFRRTTNNFRAINGCSSKWLKVLLCQKVNDVNFNHYEDKSKGFLDKYDLWNPYFKYINSKEINLFNI